MLGREYREINMQAFRAVQHVSEDGYIKIKVPSGMGKRVEVILLPVASEDADADADAAVADARPAALQHNGFCMQVLGSEEEDVWNDL